MIQLNQMQTVAITTATGTASQESAAIVSIHLCRPVCQNQQIQPTYNIKYAIGDTYTDGTTTFVEIVASGSVHYVPKGRGVCCGITQAFSEKTMIAFYNGAATSVPTISIAQGKSDGVLTKLDCTTGRGYMICTDIRVSAVYA